MVFHTNDGKSTTEIFLKKFTYAWDVPVYECGLIDTSVLEEHTLIIVSIYSSNLKSAMKTVSFFFRRFWKITKSDRPYTHMKQLGSYWMDFHEIWHLKIFTKSDRNTQVSLKSDKSNGYLT